MASGKPSPTCDAGFLVALPSADGPATQGSCLEGLGCDHQPGDLPEPLPALPETLLRKEGRLWVQEG